MLFPPSRPHVRTAVRRPRRGALALLTALLSIAVLPIVSATPATAQSDATVVVDGRGWGHGRGMSQWGALGYAVNYGWSAGQILDHYYGGTANGGADDHNLRVLLQGQTGPSVILYHPLAQLRTSADGDQASRSALRMDRLADGTWQLYDGASCAGPWTPWGAPTATTAITAWPVAETEDPSSSVQVCDATGARAYRGHLELRAANGGAQTLNVVPRENYLRSVVALEVSASWWDIGRVPGVDGSGGGQAVMAQAVAARSYVEAGDTRYVSSTADTCDSTLCQVYGGRARRTTGALASIEHPNIDAAVYHTRNTIRVHGNGAVARTEFSSSTGGHTAGGTFPAVPDLGDAYAGNPNHRWQQTIAVSSIESAFGAGLGQFVGLSLIHI